MTGRDLYEILRDVFRAEGTHWPPWDDLSKGLHVAWEQIAIRMGEVEVREDRPVDT